MKTLLVGWRRVCIAVVGAALALGFSAAAAGAAKGGAAYEEPATLGGTIYETSSGTNKVLFTFMRTAVRSNATVHVTRDFLYPSGNAGRARAIGL